MHLGTPRDTRGKGPRHAQPLRQTWEERIKERKYFGTDRCPASKGELGLPARLRSSLPFLPSKPFLPQEIHLLCVFHLRLRETYLYVIQFSILGTVLQPLSVWLNFGHVSDDGQFFDLSQVPAHVVRSRHLVGHQLYCLFESALVRFSTFSPWVSNKQCNQQISSVSVTMGAKIFFDESLALCQLSVKTNLIRLLLSEYKMSLLRLLLSEYKMSLPR